MFDRAGLAEFLRHRREALQPEDVGLPRGARRRTHGLRREEVAALSHMSTDYYGRLEQQRGPRPSPQMLSSLAQGLHLSRAERDHLFRLVGHQPLDARTPGDHVSPGLLRILDRLDDTPAEIVNELGETLRQNALGVALSGDLTRYEGPMRSLCHRWFVDPATRARHPVEDHDHLSRLYASHAREVATRRGPGSRAARLVEGLVAVSPEFRAVYEQHEVGLAPPEAKRLCHPELGLLELNCQTLLDPHEAHRLLVYTATPGSETAERLALLGTLAARGT